MAVNRKEQIQALKDNEKPFGLMDKELQGLVKEFWDSSYLQTVRELTGTWADISSYTNDSPILNITYRLRPDYEEEPEIERANLGCATTGELLQEILVRVEIAGINDYRTVDGY